MVFVNHVFLSDVYDEFCPICVDLTRREQFSGYIDIFPRSDGYIHVSWKYLSGLGFLIDLKIKEVHLI